MMGFREFKMLVLSRSDVAAAIDFKDAIEAIEQAQTAYQKGNIQTLPFSSMGVEGRGGFISYAALDEELGIACQIVYSEYRRSPETEGMPLNKGIHVLSDTTNAMPIVLMERSLLTEVVTGSVSATGAKYLVAQSPKVVGIIGCGFQGRSHIRALKVAVGFEEAIAYDIRPEATDAYAAEMQPELGVPVRCAANVEELVRACDVIAAVTRPAPRLIESRWLKPGAVVVVANGGMIDYEHVDKIVVDDWSHVPESTLEKTLVAEGTIAEQDVTELAEIITGEAEGRRNAEDKIVFTHRGMAINHLMVSYRAYQRAKEKGLGIESPVF